MSLSVIAHQQIWNPRKLTIKESRIKGAGKGVFAKENIRRGMIACSYMGLYSGDSDCNHDSDYVWELTDPFRYKGKKIKFVDGDPKAYGKFEQNPGHFPNFGPLVNGAANKRQRKKINVELAQIGLVLYYRATRPINAGDELIADYGKEYFTSRDLDGPKVF